MKGGMSVMKKFYMIKYEYEGKTYERIVRPKESPLDVIESLLRAGAKVVDYTTVPTCSIR